MITASYLFAGAKVKYYFEQSIKGIDSFCRRDKTIIITDKNVQAHYAGFLEGRKVIVLEPGEQSKTMATVEHIVHQLVEWETDRDYFIIGMGGGVVTDITGLVASVYMRGLPFAFIPTSLLGMVDAALGGKNGVNSGLHKNIIGTITQPRWIIFDRTVLYTLPHEEWVNAFAEIVKYAAVFDEPLFRTLEQHSLDEFRDKHYLTAKLLYICTHIKSLVVERDVFEQGERRLLNFGHTLGHAIENVAHIPHGKAVAAGMVFAAALSEQITGFAETVRLVRLLEKFGLEPRPQYDKTKALEL
ncbi:MAG: 3-dehydroquinate synthase, partial [Dinghuibacter sp.]|nr:3-dehydroquinate synthase [Dinghuibacter sp.]